MYFVKLFVRFLSDLMRSMMEIALARYPCLVACALIISRFSEGRKLFEITSNRDFKPIKRCIGTWRRRDLVSLLLMQSASSKRSEKELVSAESVERAIRRFL